MGIRLTRLLKAIALLSKKKNGGGHVMIKIYIEGGEYKLVEEPIPTKVLCKLMLRHNAKTLGSKEPGKRWKHIKGEQTL
jgi:hypothetical protein